MKRFKEYLEEKKEFKIDFDKLEKMIKKKIDKGDVETTSYPKDSITVTLKNPYIKKLFSWINTLMPDSNTELSVEEIEQQTILSINKELTKRFKKMGFLLTKIWYETGGSNLQVPNQVTFILKRK